MILNEQFILASNSYSRKRLLENAGLSFFTEKPLCDEEYIKNQFLKPNESFTGSITIAVEQ